jgi:myo-inositol-1(or 4)-monophosphatase
METDYLEIAIQAARAAGQIQRERLWSDYSIAFKGEKNLVTDVDRLSEDLIVRQLRAACPDCGILAEERGALGGGSPLRWIIDPLDGTTNYAHGFPWFAVSIALEISGDHTHSLRETNPPNASCDPLS